MLKPSVRTYLSMGQIFILVSVCQNLLRHLSSLDQMVDAVVKTGERSAGSCIAG